MMGEDLSRKKRSKIIKKKIIEETTGDLLMDVSFEKGNFSNVDLDFIEIIDPLEVYFYNCNFSGSSLKNCFFPFVGFINCNFDNCDLSYTNFHRSDMEGSSFNNAKIDFAKINCSNLNKTNIQNANLDNIKKSLNSYIKKTNKTKKQIYEAIKNFDGSFYGGNKQSIIGSFLSGLEKTNSRLKIRKILLDMI